MKILHICLTGPYTDGLSYQDNLLSKYHKYMGHDVSLIAPKYSYADNGEIIRDDRDTYLNEYGIKIIRLENKFGTITSKFKKYRNVYTTIANESPDILFIHGVQFVDINKIVKYIKKNKNIKVYADNHADFSNSATNWLSRNILHRLIWKGCAQKIEPYTTKFYGVLPARVDFIINMYNLPEEKVELLVMGADDEKINTAENNKNRWKTREFYNIGSNDFLIITGGKINNSKKQVLDLMKSIKEMDRTGINLLVYGSVSKELQEEFNELLKHETIQYIGWIDDDTSYKIFSAADLIIFPGRHSVYWEQAVAMGMPLMVKHWEGTTHIDIGGNCIFLHEDSVEEIKNEIESLLDSPNQYSRMLKAAKSSKKDEFLYSNIAKKSLEP